MSGKSSDTLHRLRNRRFRNLICYVGRNHFKIFDKKHSDNSNVNIGIAAVSINGCQINYGSFSLSASGSCFALALDIRLCPSCFSISSLVFLATPPPAIATILFSDKVVGLFFFDNSVVNASAKVFTAVSRFVM